MKKKICAAGLLVMLLFAMSLAVFWYKNKDVNWEKAELVQEAMERAEQLKTDALFLSMYPIVTYNEDILYTCLLATADFLQVPIESGEQLVGILEEILEKPNKLERIFLGINQESILPQDSQGKLPTYKSTLVKQGFSWEEAILELGKRYPDKIFDIMLYSPEISYWTAQEESSIQEALEWYAYVGEMYSHYDVVENVHVFMPGAEEWLICNESNYLEDGQVTDVVANELEKLVFCDYKTIMVPVSVAEQCDRLKVMIERYREAPPEYGLLEEYTFVFLGDSVIGNYTDSMSIPGVAAYMTGGKTINCGYGGLAAAKAQADDIGLTSIMDQLLSESRDNSVDGLGNETAQAGIRQFWKENPSPDSDKLVFLISFGINDYATGRPVYKDEMDDSSYVGALTEAIDRLRAAYPKSEIVLMTPNYVEIFEHGTMDNSGLGYVFTDYVKALRKLAEEKNCFLVDVYKDLGLTAENTLEYLADGCHPNYFGRFKIAEMVWEKLSQWLVR